MTDSPNETRKATQAPPNSTLIEFPGVNRNRPAWRKELSEKVREIQRRRAREAALGDEPHASCGPESHAVSAAHNEGATETAAAGGADLAKQLGLVPPPETPEMNPLVLAALRRIERARTQTQPAPRSSHGRAQAAAARVIEEHYEEEAAPVNRPAGAPLSEQAGASAADPHARAEDHPGAGAAGKGKDPGAHSAAGAPARALRGERAEVKQPANLVVVVPPRPRPKSAVKHAEEGEAGVGVEVKDGPGAGTPAEQASARVADAAPARGDVRTAAGVPEQASSSVAASAAVEVAKPQPRKVAGVIDDNWLERQGAELLPKVQTATYDDRAPVGQRVGAALIDLAAVALLCAPFAAVIELTIGEWHDSRVLGSMAAIVALVMFLYHTCSVALAGRTPGMHFFSLHAVDADTALVPTTWQCAGRALGYMVSLAAFGLGVLYALIDAEGRTAHDLVSRTVVVKQ